jgi:hypothetical protein
MAIKPDLHGDHARFHGDHATFAIHQFRSINFAIEAISNALSARQPPFPAPELCRILAKAVGARATEDKCLISIVART